MSEANEQPPSAQVWLHRQGESPVPQLIAKDRFLVGRSPDADVAIEEETVSWEHLELSWRSPVLMATDLDSRNGTLLNGVRIDRPRKLRTGDVLTVGTLRIEVNLSSGPQQSTLAVPGPTIELTGEERAVAQALVAPLRVPGALAPKPASRAEIGEAVGLSDKSVQRRMESLARKLDVPPDAGQDRPRLVAARVLELGLYRSS